MSPVRLSQDPHSWLKALALLAVPFELFLIGYAVAPVAAPEGPRTLRAGAVRVEFAPGWRRIVDPPGLVHPDGSRLRIRATQRATAPGERVVGLVDAGGGGTGVVVKTGAERTWAFATRGGGVRIECRNGGAADRCAGVVSAVEVSGVLPPSPDPDTARSLSAAVRAIAGTPAPRLAAAYGLLAATARSASAEGDAFADVASAARMVAADLRAVNRAKDRKNRRGHATARTRLAADHRRLRQALGALRARGYTVEKGPSS